MELTASEPRRKSLVQLYLDGEPGPKIDKEVFLLSRLKPGDTLSPEELEDLVERSDVRRAREKAMYLLEHRSHSKRELTEKVARSGASREAAQAAADRLEELGLIDDGAYARDLARELVERKRYGLRRVRQELARKGIRRELVEEILAPYGEDGDSFRENMTQVLERKYPQWREDEKTRRRAIAALQRLGYSYDQIRETMGTLQDSWEDWET
ncbi:MAG: regulatory protein RecX [Acutalibacter sp.]|jgi:regulatory protein